MKNKHNWVALCSDINTHWSKTFHWWKCSKCGVETEHSKNNNISMPCLDGCNDGDGTDKVFPLSSI